MKIKLHGCEFIMNEETGFDFDGFSSRLREAIFPRKLQEVATEAGVSQSVISGYINPRDGKSGPRLDIVARLAGVLGVSLDWLVFAKGDGPDGSIVRIPLYDVRLAAGPGAWNERAPVIDRIPFTANFLKHTLKRRSPDGLVMFEIIGDSMGDRLPDGAQAIVDTGDNRVSDGIFAFVQDDEARVKRVKRLVDGLMLISDNPAYPEEVVKGAQLNKIAIIGRLLWAARAM